MDVIQTRTYNVTAFGAQATGTGFDNWPVIQPLLDNALPGATFLFPAANSMYYFSQTLQIPINKSVTIIGESYQNTVLLFRPMNAGIRIQKSNYLNDHSRIENLKITFTGKTTLDGKDASGAVSLAYGSDYKSNGIEVYARSSIRHVFITNGSGNGIVMHGNLSNGSNVSGSQIDNVQVSAMTGCGIYIDGADANAVAIINPDIRDNKGYGLYDGSFLGISVYGGMFHNNTKGHIYQTSEVAFSTCVGTYFESDNSKQSQASGVVSVVGGFQRQGWTGAKVGVMAGNRFNKVGTRSPANAGYEEIALAQTDDGTQPAWLLDAGLGQRFFMRNVVSDPKLKRARFVQAWGGVPGNNPTTIDNIWQIVGANTLFEYKGTKRYLNEPSHGFNHLFVGETFICVAPNTTAIPKQNYHKGDRILNPLYDGSENSVREWVCTQPGTVGSATGKGTNTWTAGSDTVAVTSQNQLRDGYYVRLGAEARQIVKVIPTAPGSTYATSYIVDAAPTTSGTAGTAYQAPLWKPVYDTPRLKVIAADAVSLTLDIDGTTYKLGLIPQE